MGKPGLTTPPTVDLSDLVTVPEACKLVPGRLPGKGPLPSTIYRWVHRGKVRGWRRCGQLFVSREDLLGMFEPVEVQGRQKETAGERRKRQEQTQAVLKEWGIV